MPKLSIKNQKKAIFTMIIIIVIIIIIIIIIIIAFILMHYDRYAIFTVCA